jgi:hypothetical protein
MTSYRGYAIRSDGRIKRGAYLAASTPLEAHHAAVELCDETVDHIEVWADATKLDEVDCQDSEGGSDSSGGDSSASAS